MTLRLYRNHLRSSDDLVTSYEATRAGFVALALERNRRSTYVAEARALQEAASRAKTPADLLTITDIEAGLLTDYLTKLWFIYSQKTGRKPSMVSSRIFLSRQEKNLLKNWCLGFC